MLIKLICIYCKNVYWIEDNEKIICRTCGSSSFKKVKPPPKPKKTPLVKIKESW